MSVENDQWISSGNDTVDFDYESQVYCPMMGYFYTSGGDVPVRIAVDSWYWSGTWNVSGCTYYPACTGTCTTPNRTIKGTKGPSSCPEFEFCANLVVAGGCWLVAACIPSPVPLWLCT
jgi:hypothetical protein